VEELSGADPASFWNGDSNLLRLVFKSHRQTTSLSNEAIPVFDRKRIVSRNNSARYDTFGRTVLSGNEFLIDDLLVKH
jgi:hypothetical protein